MAKEPWQEDAEKGWRLLSWEGQAQWFATRTAPHFPGKQTLGGRLTDLSQLIGTIRNAAELGWDLYLQANPANPVRGKIKLSRADITYWRYIVIDLDPSPYALIPPDFNNVAHRIFSGRGYQCWVPVYSNSVDELHPKAFPAAEQIMSAYLRYHHGKPWLNGWVIDTSCSDLARVVRCPGSINQKTGKRSAVEFDGGTGKLLSQLEELNVVPPETRTRIERAESLADVLPHLTVLARRFIIDGVETPGRHTAAWHTAKLLHELGVSQKVAGDWMMQGACSCRPADERFIREVEIAVTKIYREAQ